MMFNAFQIIAPNRLDSGGKFHQFHGCETVQAINKVLLVFNNQSGEQLG